MPTLAIDQAIQIATRKSQAGRLADAEAICRQILLQDANQVDAINLLGIIAVQSGHVDAALDLIGRAIQLKPDYADAHNNLGNILKAKGQVDAAIASFQRAIQLKPA